jgi:hypothetical protein
MNIFIKKIKKMANEKSIVEEAIIQMKNLEETVAQNAKGILASTMKQEIKDLVKESLFESKKKKKGVEEDDDEEMDFEDTDVADVEFDDDDEEMDDDDMDDDDMDDEEDMDDDDMDDEDMEDDEEVIDLTNAPTSQVMKVYSLLDPNDEIVITKDKKGNTIFKDNETDKEYLVVSEGMEKEDIEGMFADQFMDEEFDGLEDEEDYYPEGGYETMESDVMSMDEETIYELEMEDEGMMNMDEDDDMMSMYEDDDVESMMSSMDEETIYELEVEDENMMGMDEEDDEEFEGLFESKKSKKSTKPKGIGFGNAQSYKMSKTPNMDGGFKVVGKNANKMMGTGSAKKANIYKKDSPSFDGEFKGKPTHRKERKEGMVTTPKKMETKEASRTLGAGSKFRKGGLPKPRTYSKFNTNIEESFNQHELEILREKNEEYRKALNIFRNKLNEVATFNSNLAYATRLFTEHSTSKQEKINILKRFDSVETIKESKNLYKTIKDELTSSKPQQVSESIERTIAKAPSTGSAVNLIESKTYENPQFLRMKDLMSKLK